MESCGFPLANRRVFQAGETACAKALRQEEIIALFPEKAEQPAEAE